LPECVAHPGFHTGAKWSRIAPKTEFIAYSFDRMSQARAVVIA
jgi:hypothetical protein